MGLGKPGTWVAVGLAGTFFLSGINAGLKRVRESQAARTPIMLPAAERTLSKLTEDTQELPATPPAPTAAAGTATVRELSPAQLFALASPSVALVEVKDRLGKLQGQGSGFFVTADGLLVTNYHVIEGGHLATISCTGDRTHDVVGVVAADPDADLAVLRVRTDAPVPVLTLSSKPPSIGTRVFAIGNPLGLTNTFSDGLISGFRSFDTGEPTLIQISAPISPGSSGGPLLTIDGRVVGVTTAGIFGLAQNLNFVVHAEHVARLLKEVSQPRPLAELAKRTNRFMSLERVEAIVDAKDYAAAAEALRELRQRQDGVPLYHLLLGRLQEEYFDNLDLAQSEYTMATRHGADYAPAHDRLGRLLLRRGIYLQAIGCFKRVAELEPGQPNAYQYAGICHVKMNEHARALAFFDHALKLDGADTMTMLLRARSLLALKRDGDALAAYRSILRIEPQSVDGLNGLGDVFFLSNRLGDAKDAFMDVVRLYPLDPHAHLQLGVLARRNGDRSKAYGHWLKAAAVDRHGADGRQAVKLLTQLMEEGGPGVDPRRRR